MSAAKQIETELSAYYPQGESKALVRLLLYHVAGWTLTDLLVGTDLTLTGQQQTTINNAVERLKKYEPIQYILGCADFCGFRFKIDKNVLIPRPETAELVRLVVENVVPNARLIDIGTGSGCIAVSIAKLLPEAHVSACDISCEALAVAAENAHLNDVCIDFTHTDILHPTHIGGTYDAIVSNPPYVMQSERTAMDKNVLDYEPATALFVPNEQPLLFYDKMADFALAHLANNGKLFFEINHLLADATTELMRAKGFAQVKTIEDSFGKKRFVTAEKR